MEGFNELNTDDELEELMAGICPEDLSFNASFIGLTTPLKKVDNVPQPLHVSTPNVKLTKKNVTISMVDKNPVTEQHTTRTKDTIAGGRISKSVVEKVNKVLGPDFHGFKLSSEVKNTGLKQCDQLTVYPEETFYGLPEDVSKCLEEFKGITKLYGQNE